MDREYGSNLHCNCWWVIDIHIVNSIVISAEQLNGHFNFYTFGTQIPFEKKNKVLIWQHIEKISMFELNVLHILFARVVFRPTAKTDKCMVYLSDTWYS